MDMVKEGEGRRAEYDDGSQVVTGGKDGIARTLESWDLRVLVEHQV